MSETTRPTTRDSGSPSTRTAAGSSAIIRKEDAPKVSNLTTLSGISCISYRGSDLGAGFALFDPSLSRGGGQHAQDQGLRQEPGDSGRPRGPAVRLRQLPERRPAAGARPDEAGGSASGSGRRTSAPRDDHALERTIDSINAELLSDGKIDGRVFSYGRYLDVFKDVGYPLEVAKEYHLDAEPKKADAWIAHTRQPTNSPGRYPIWSHPFASMDCAIAHNGDISSFGANLEQLNSWGLRSHVGTDSEVIARLLDHLVRVEGLSLFDAATLMTNPFERQFSPEVRRLLIRYRGARLDGPSRSSPASPTVRTPTSSRSPTGPSSARSWSGRTTSRFYVASEENQIQEPLQGRRRLGAGARLLLPRLRQEGHPRDQARRRRSTHPSGRSRRCRPARALSETTPVARQERSPPSTSIGVGFSRSTSSCEAQLPHGERLRSG